MDQVYRRKEECCGCSACSAACPFDAIQMREDRHGFMYPVIDQDKCTDCGLCSRICRFHEKKIKKDAQPKVYAAVNKDDEKRMGSSSGGIFIELAQAVIKKGGCVYGAGFDRNFYVRHERAEDMQGCREFQGSKYVQSSMNGCYQRVKRDLLDGKRVLFTGLPCQTDGLKAYLGRDYERLYLADLACHGAASPGVWFSYMRKRAGTKTVRSVSFRDKSNGWKKYSLKMEYGSDNYLATQDADPYMTLFLDRLIVRDSCFRCPYNSFHRESDITLADFWGIEAFKPHLDDGRGTSAVLVSTKKGQDLFDEIKEHIVYEESSMKECLQGPFEVCMKPNSKSEMFWRLYDQNEFRAIDKYGKYSLARILIVRAVIPVLRKMGLYRVAMEFISRKRQHEI